MIELEIFLATVLVVSQLLNVYVLGRGFVLFAMKSFEC
jgi:hypothetical protein